MQYPLNFQSRTIKRKISYIIQNKKDYIVDFTNFFMKLMKVPLSELKYMKKKGLDNTVPSDSSHYDTIVAYIHPNPLVRWVFWKRFKTMLSLSRKSLRVLDFGSGSGVFLPSLSRNFKEAYSIDIETKSAQHIKNKFNLDNLRIIKNDSMPLPFKDNFFDIVFAADVLEHLKDSESMQKELHRIIKPGGCIIVSGPTETRFYDLVRRIIFRRKNASEHYRNIHELMNQTAKFFRIDKIKTVPSRIIPGFEVYRAVKE